MLIEILREISKVISGNDATSERERSAPTLSSILTVSWIRSIVLIGIGVAVTQQAYGIIIMMMFGTNVLEEAGLETKMALIANIGIGASGFGP